MGEAGLSQDSEPESLERCSSSPFCSAKQKQRNGMSLCKDAAQAFSAFKNKNKEKVSKFL